MCGMAISQLIKHFLVIFILFFSSLFGDIEKVNYNQLSKNEKYALKIFLLNLIEDSEGGYVLFNQKPICITGFEFKDPFCVDTERHQEAVALRAGSSIWKKLNKEHSDIIIHISQNIDPQIPQFTHILVINKPLFYTVVNKNLSLFQYVLGPSITPEKLFEKLVCEDQPFHALLKYDKTLIGIILGFGTENSLYASRVENIYESSNKENIPFLPSTLIQKEFNEEYLPFPPTFGFKTSKEEAETFLKRFTVSSPKLNKNKPRFVFGLLKDELENKKLIFDLEEAQNKIQELIESKYFEAEVFKKTLVKNLLNSSDQNKLNLNKKINTHEIEKIIAKGILESLKDYDFEYFPYFLEGMQNLDLQNLEVERPAYFPHYVSNFIEAKENLKTANEYFQTLDNNKDVQCIEPLKLYYKTLKIDENHKKINHGSLVTLTYSIYSSLGQCLSQNSKVVINLKNTISGFAHGVQKMAIGETRKIYIHPSLAYNYDIDSLSINKCCYLKAIVTLHEIQNEIPLSELKPINLDFLFDPEFIKRAQENYKNALRVKGATIAFHLKKSREINLSKIRDHIMKLYPGEVTTTSEEQDLINNIHWNIYFNDNG